jgi:acetyl/propionyl-CoA carboxylase alpha subunit
VALAEQCGYTGAGTVEFLLDNATGEFYFLEMNTRLQVEHPVTEEVVRVRGERIDLVELQLLVATGAVLGFEQADVTLEGHAIEGRVYAEDSFGGFLPQAGRTGYVRWPHEHPGRTVGVRVDHALVSQQEVSTSYDPMLGKVIAWGRDREEARTLLVQALDQTQVFGLTTNTGFLRVLADSDEFREATIDTAWLDHHEVPAPSRDLARVFGALMLAPTSDGVADSDSPWRSDGFRLGADRAPVLAQLDEVVAVREDRVGDHATRWLGGHRLRRLIGPGSVSAEVDGAHHDATGMWRGHTIEVIHRGQRHVFDVPDPFAPRGALTGDGDLLAPMPGTVLDVRVEVGQQVEEGDVLGVLEAMKMELAMRAPHPGTVTLVDATVGAQVPLGHVLFHVEQDRQGQGSDA